MPVRRFALRRRRAPVRRRSNRPRRYVYSKARRFGMMPQKKFFSETFVSNAITANGNSGTTNPGQIWNANITSVPQYAQYKTLYQKYRIVKLVWTFIPDFGSADPNNAELVAGSSPMWDTNARFHFVKDYTQTAAPPASEVDILGNQGCKTIMFNSRTKPIRVVQAYPVTQDALLANQGGGLTTTISTVKNRWCAFDDSVAPDHGNVLTYVQTRSLGAFGAPGQQVGTAYCKVVFECKDPR